MASVKEYPTDRIRNVAVLGHASSGKTTLIDALCFASGTSKRKGNVDDGQALTLTTPEEISHRVSMQLTPAFAEWMDTKVNFLDTPGYLDFTGDALAAVRVADAAVIVVSATAGVEVGTERVWEYCEARGIPRIVYISMMDKEHADFEAAYSDVKARLTSSAIPVDIPIGAGSDFRGIVNLFRGQAHLYKAPDGKGEFDAGPIPDDLAANVERWDTELQEALATLDEKLLEEYLEGVHISREEAIQAMARGMARNEAVPVLCGAAAPGYAVRALLRRSVQLFPHPGEAGPQPATKSGGEEAPLTAANGGPFAALVFKTTSEPHVGNLSLFRVFSGSVSNGDSVRNSSRKTDEKLNHLAVPLGKDRPSVTMLHAGDIGVASKLRDTHTNDTLTAPDVSLAIPGVEFPEPDISLAIRGKTRKDEDRVGEALTGVAEEDPTFRFEFNAELHQTIIKGLGELHLDVQIERMARKHHVEVDTERPRIAYRETITKPAEGHGRFKKQTGGRGQFGDCRLRLEPLPRGAGYEFVDEIKGGVIPGKFVPSVDRGVQDAAAKGIVAGFPAVDFRVACYDGSYHSVDSSDVAFQVAGSMAFQKAAKAADPVLLEPILEVEVTTPDEYMGDVLADATQRRGKVLGMDSDSGRTVVRARIPEAELDRYAAALRSMTQGRAFHTRSLVGYEPVPDQVAARIIEEARK